MIYYILINLLYNIYIGLGDKNILNDKSKLLSDIDSMNVLGNYFILFHNYI